MKTKRTQRKHTAVDKKHNQALINRLIFEGYKFSFTKAIDIALLLIGASLDKISAKDLIELDIKSKINFQSKYTDIFGVEGILDSAPEITVNIGGIAGLDSHLPDPYIEEYVLYNRASKHAVIDFYDILNHHILSLQYLYYKYNNISCLSVQLRESIFGKIVSSLSCNIKKKSLIPEQFSVSSHSLFWRYSRSADSLKVIISSFFNVDVEIEQFIGGFTNCAGSSELTRIGCKKQNLNVLGLDTILGSRTWDSMMGIVVHINSLNIIEYLDFLPKASAKDQKFSKLQKLKEIIKLYVPADIKTKIVFHLQEPTEICCTTQLNGEKRLNKDAFIRGTNSLDSTFFVSTG